VSGTMSFRPDMTDAGGGGYSTAGSTLLIVPDAAPATSREYCVREDKLHLIQVGMAMDMGPMGRVTITSDLVGTRMR
jgi:hypothetical protein